MLPSEDGTEDYDDEITINPSRRLSVDNPKLDHDSEDEEITINPTRAVRVKGCLSNNILLVSIVEKEQESHSRNQCSVYINNHTLHYIHTKEQACDANMASVLVLIIFGFHLMLHYNFTG